jgi:hypothetical protein
VSPVRYEQGSYIPQDDILQSHSRESLKSYVVPSPLIIVTLMMEALSSSETLRLIRATRRHIPEDGILFLVSIRP